jgi:hypothetical protein
MIGFRYFKPAFLDKDQKLELTLIRNILVKLFKIIYLIVVGLVIKYNISHIADTYQEFDIYDHN